MSPREIEARAAEVAKRLNYDADLTSQQMDADDMVAMIVDVFSATERVAPVCGKAVSFYVDQYRCGLNPNHDGVCWPLLPSVVE